MSILSRLGNLIKSNLNSAVDKLSDPAKEIDLLIEEMEDELKQLRVTLRDQLVQEKLAHADAVLAAPLAPAVQTAIKSLKQRKVDATSAEGKRVAAILVRVEARLDASADEVRAGVEQRAADLADGTVDISLGKLALALQMLERIRESVCQR